MIIKNIKGEEFEINGCLGCELVTGKLEPVGGVLYKDNHFIVTQDYELPINGFIIISSVKHCEKLEELTDDERIELITLSNKIMNLLRSYEVCDEFNMILEEKSGYHFHVWIMPRHKWMIEKFGKVLKNIKAIQEYATANMGDSSNIEKIEETCRRLKRDLN